MAAASVKIATVVYLYVRIITNNGSEDSRTAFASMEACQQAAQTARIVVANSGDSEGAAAMWCGGSKDDQWGDEWHRSTVAKIKKGK